MSQNSDPGVISKALHHQLKGQRKRNTKAMGEDQQWLPEVNYNISVLSCDGFWQEKSRGRRSKRRCRVKTQKPPKEGPKVLGIRAAH